MSTEQIILAWAAREVLPDLPDDAIPAAPDLQAWIGEAPESALEAAGRALDVMTGAAGWRWHPYRVEHGAVAITRVDGSPVKEATIAAWRVDGHSVFSQDLTRVHATFHAFRESCEPGETAPEHPAITLVRAWLSRVVTVTPETRRDRRILPRITVSESRPERRAGMLFGGIHEGRRIEAPELPLFPKVAPEKRVPILDLVDLAGVPVMARGRGAPLPMRLFVRALASVPPAARKLESTRIALTLRELRDGLFPHGWRYGQHWPALRDALIHARDYAIHDGRGRWWPLALRSMPDNPKLDDHIVLEVAFPPGQHSGPAVNLPAMDALSVESAARWRAYIGASVLAWQPGITRVPARRGGRFGWARNRDAYPILTVEDRRRLAFGAGWRSAPAI